MSARDEILARIRSATVDVTESDPAKDVPVAWEYNQPTPLDDVLDTFEENILDYKARIVRTPAKNAATEIVSALKEVGASSVVVPSGVEQGWVDAITASGIKVLRDEPQLSHAELNEVHAVLTSSCVSVAETGTICLDHRPDQGRRALTLIPDRHICVVPASSVVSDIPEAMLRMRDAIDNRRPLTWISGGSATSDIELSRVEGVHGPRKLFVVLAE